MIFSCLLCAAFCISKAGQLEWHSPCWYCPIKHGLPFLLLQMETANHMWKCIMWMCVDCVALCETRIEILTFWGLDYYYPSPRLVFVKAVWKSVPSPICYSLTLSSSFLWFPLSFLSSDSIYVQVWQMFAIPLPLRNVCSKYFISRTPARGLSVDLDHKYAMRRLHGG